jgi:tRNA dimethylallyltransferase
VGEVKIPVVVVGGPTASGKSALGLELAVRFGGEIVNGDSLQLYRGMDIGTAKPTREEMAAAPHHLFDVLEPDAVFNAGEYAARARACIKEIHGRGRTAFVVGGTGFYLRALFEGLAPGPGRDEALRKRLLEREGRRPGVLRRLLRRYDAESAARIQANDRNKLLRALEICLLTRDRLGAMYGLGRAGFEGAVPLKLVLQPPREALKERIAERTRRMFERGLVEELAGLWARGVPKQAKAFEAIGYRQAGEVLEGRLTSAEAEELVAVATRQYAKRQLTWFRRERGVRWLAGFGEEAGIRTEAAGLVGEFLRDNSAFELKQE